MPAAAVLAVLLGVVLPDFRVLAAVGYTPILLVGRVLGFLPDDVGWTDAWPWPTVNAGLLTAAGLTFAVVAVRARRRQRAACPRCGRGDLASRWASPPALRRWGAASVAIAVVVPVGYAVTRFAWALGIPLGVRGSLLDEMGSSVYSGAGLAALGVGGAALTLVQRWGEAFPRWVPWLRGRPVPVALALAATAYRLRRRGPCRECGTAPETR